MRALPDPKGCSFHRHDWETGEPEGRPYAESVINKKVVKQTHRVGASYIYEMITVTKCQDFELSPRAIDDAENVRYNRQRGAELNRLKRLQVAN
jgi:hypothetical protein